MKISDEPFYAILKDISVTIPGDERSRTNPGHGYPEHTITNCVVEPYPNREVWEKEVKLLSKRNAIFKAVKIIPAKVSVTTSVIIEEENES